MASMMQAAQEMRAFSDFNVAFAGVKVNNEISRTAPP